MPKSINDSYDLNNPGHIERGKDWKKWQGVDLENQPHPRFLRFLTPVDGVRAIARTLLTYYDKRFSDDGSKIDTPREIAARWSETDQQVYALNIAKAVGCTPDATLDLHDFRTMFACVKTIIRQENGKEIAARYTDTMIEEACRRVGIVPPPPPPAAAVASDSGTQLLAISTAASTAAGIVSTTAEIWDTLAARIDVRYLIWAFVAAAIGTLVWRAYRKYRQAQRGF